MGILICSQDDDDEHAELPDGKLKTVKLSKLKRFNALLQILFSINFNRKGTKEN